MNSDYCSGVVLRLLPMNNCARAAGSSACTILMMIPYEIDVYVGVHEHEHMNKPTNCRVTAQDIITVPVFFSRFCL